MRETHTAQRSIFQTTTDHEIAYELKRMSDWLDAHPELLDLMAGDLRSGGGSSSGRRGMTLESVLRCAILKQYRQLDYRTLAFFCRTRCLLLSSHAWTVGERHRSRHFRR